MKRILHWPEHWFAFHYSWSGCLAEPRRFYWLLPVTWPVLSSALALPHLLPLVAIFFSFILQTMVLCPETSHLECTFCCLYSCNTVHEPVPVYSSHNIFAGPCLFQHSLQVVGVLHYGVILEGGYQCRRLSFQDSVLDPSISEESHI